MPTVTVPPLVNDQGNLNVHSNEGCSVPIIVQNEQGEEVDASAISMFFISGSFRKELGLDPSDLNARLLVLTPIDLTSITHGAAFRVVDESNPLQPVNRWEGRIYKRG